MNIVTVLNLGILGKLFKYSWTRFFIAGSPVELTASENTSTIDNRRGASNEVLKKLGRTEGGIFWAKTPLR